MTATATGAGMCQSLIEISTPTGVTIRVSPTTILTITGCGTRESKAMNPPTNTVLRSDVMKMPIRALDTAKPKSHRPIKPMKKL